MIALAPICYTEEEHRLLRAIANARAGNYTRFEAALATILRGKLEARGALVAGAIRCDDPSRNIVAESE